MKNKTVVIVLGVALVLFVYIFAIDKHLLTTDEKKARSENVFQHLRVDKITKIELATPKGRIVLEANQPKAGEEKTWKITSPSFFLADETEVQAIVSSLDFLIATREVKEDRDKKQFGFGAPLISGIIHQGNDTTSFLIGTQTSDEQHVYVALDNVKDKFFVASEDFFDAMNKNVNDLRDKYIVQSELTDIQRIVVRNPQNQLFLTRNESGHNWSVSHQDMPFLASTNQIKQLIHAVKQLKAQKFVTDNAKNLKKYGLDSTKISISLKLAKNKEFTVALGNPCEKESVYAHLKGTTSVQCVSTKFLSMLQYPQKRYFEKRLIPIEVATISKIELHTPNSQMTLSKTDEPQWSVTGLAQSEPSQVAVDDFLQSIAEVSAKEVLFESGLQSNGIQLETTPRAKITVHAIDKTKFTVSLFASQSPSDHLWMQRDQFAAWSPVSEDTLALLAPEPNRFRKKIINNGGKNQITTVEIVHANTQQVLAKKEGHWKIISPVEATTDRTKIKKLIQFISETPVKQYLSHGSEAFDASHIFATITSSFVIHNSQENGEQDITKSTPITIEIGEKSDDNSRYARIVGQEDLQFTVDAEFYNFLDKPLAARNLLQVNSQIINKIVYSDSNLQFSAVKNANKWKSDQCELNSDALNRIIIDFGAIKSISSHEFRKDLEDEFLQVEFHSDTNTPPAILRFGKEHPLTDGYVAKRDGLPITFILPKRIIDELQGACKKHL